MAKSSEAECGTMYKLTDNEDCQDRSKDGDELLSGRT